MKNLRLSSNEVLILALVKAGFTTAYDFVSKVRIGVGSSMPIFRKLESMGLLKSDSGPRNRMEFTLTPKGTRALEEAPEAGIKKPLMYGISNADPFVFLRRELFLAWLQGGKLDRGAREKLFQRCVEEAVRRVERRSDRAGRDLADAKAALARHEEDLHLPLGTAREEAAATVYRLIAAQVEVLQTDSQLEGLQRLKELISSLSGIPGPGPRADHEVQGHPKARK
jgi:DNA-binding PadR family transcriptional regulator